MFIWFYRDFILVVESLVRGGIQAERLIDGHVYMADTSLESHRVSITEPSMRSYRLVMVI